MMVFLGTTFIGGLYTAQPTPTSAKNMKYLTLHGGKYSDLYGTQNPDLQQSLDIPSEWDWDTIMRADFSTGTTVAGNIDWLAENVSAVVVKRRIAGTFKWYTIASYPIEVEEDFIFDGIDKFNQSGVTYEYALVPYDNDNNPGVYGVMTVDSHFDDIFVVGRERTYKTFFSSGNIDTTRNIPGNYNVPLNARYPIFFHSGLMNYDSGTVDGKYFDIDEYCQLVKDSGYEFKKGLTDFLTDGEPKVLKHSDGRIWLIQVVPSPTDSGDITYQFRNIVFNWIQVGEHDSNEDMYWSNLNDVAQIYWNA